MKSAATGFDLRLYADHTYLLLSNQNVSSIEKHLNVDFITLCEWCINNKLSIHLVEHKTECILFKKRKKQYPVSKISRNKNKFKHYSVVE